MKRNVRGLIDSEEAKKTVIKKLREAKEASEQGRVGFVSGVLLSDGPLYIARNFVVLTRYKRLIKKKVNFPVFSAIDFIDRLALIRLVHRAYISQKFWKEILHSGYITDIFMTPGWRESNGAVKEYQMAKKLGIKINHVKLDDKKIIIPSSD